MRHRISLTVLFFIIFCVISPLGAQNTIKHKKDSLRQAIDLSEGEEKLKTYNRLSSLYMQEVRKENVIDTVFAILDEMNAEARRQNDLSYQGYAQSNKLVSLLNNGAKSYDELIRRAPAALDFLYTNKLWRQYYQTHIILSDTYRRKGDYEQALQEAVAIYNHAKDHHHTGGMGLVQIAMSRIYTSQRRFSDSENCLRESIMLLRDSTEYLSNLTTAYSLLGQNLVAQQRYEDALLVSSENEEVIRRYEESLGSTQLSAWQNLWLLYLEVYLQTGQYDMAEIYLDKVESTGHTNLYENRAQLLYGRKQYKEALDMVEKAIDATMNKLQPKGLKMMILIAAGEAQSAYDLFSEIITELDTKHNANFTAQLDEIRTEYEVERHIAERKRNRNYFLFALAGCMLLTLLVGGLFYYNRIISIKNRGLYMRIKEQDRLADKLSWMTSDKEVIQLDKDENPVAGDKQQRELITRLRSYLDNDRNFAKPDIGRDDLVGILGTNKNILSDAVKAVSGKTLMEYIRNMQLEEARRMLENHSELTIEAIAFDCGFNAPNTFYRLFQKHYEISPAEYRKISRLHKG